MQTQANTMIEPARQPGMLRPALTVFVALSLVTGLLYPGVVSGIARALFPAQAGGSLIVKDGKTVGSALIGQSFSAPKYFWGRLSATAPMPYNATASGGSNLGPTNPALTDAARARIDALRAADPDNRAPIPVDLVTASGSGLDPHISPAAAQYQAARVARARGVPQATIDALIAAHTEAPTLGVLGEPGVNVLQLNLALDALK
ncbi:MAG: potassium-transporting ATPase subunit KdpC [Cupriavidus sp.]|uniref:potassium-transporting ATPase subunit KdpC n=1 Tax=Cupriavidus pauculus TaxID=82633 RepID=UPI000785BB5F|nr:potassium-transporting ATPase subunit KdpC [Cupriavidus pauculus]MBU64547.1 potassium-transporting ATPase subunit KdpC [Cupriavidus sp.]